MIFSPLKQCCFRRTTGNPFSGHPFNTKSIVLLFRVDCEQYNPCSRSCSNHYISISCKFRRKFNRLKIRITYSNFIWSITRNTTVSRQLFRSNLSSTN